MGEFRKSSKPPLHLMIMDQTTGRLSKPSTIIAVIIGITPLCGFLFQCGCDWPWAGLDANCNVHQPHAAHRCPWCVSPLFFVISAAIGLWIAFSCVFPRAPVTASPHPVLKGVLRSMLGLLIFAGCMILTAGITAAWQDYPYGIGSFWH